MSSMTSTVPSARIVKVITNSLIRSPDSAFAGLATPASISTPKMTASARHPNLRIPTPRPTDLRLRLPRPGTDADLASTRSA